MTCSDKGYTRINILSTCSRSVETAKHKRIFISKRTSELVALMAISSTLFLFLHTRDLHTRLRSLQSVTNSASTSDCIKSNSTIICKRSCIIAYNPENNEFDLVTSKLKNIIHVGRYGSQCIKND